MEVGVIRDLSYVQHCCEPQLASHIGSKVLALMCNSSYLDSGPVEGKYLVRIVIKNDGREGSQSVYHLH
jgi:hypothetical protein